LSSSGFLPAFPVQETMGRDIVLRPSRSHGGRRMTGTGRDRTGGGEPAGRGRPTPPRKTVEEAYQHAVKTAMRSSLLAAVGFGVALLMMAMLAQGPGPARSGYALEHLLALGGVFGGAMFALIAARAARVAKSCERRLSRGRH
jgi:hypothetical protein